MYQILKFFTAVAYISIYIHTYLYISIVVLCSNIVLLCSILLVGGEYKIYFIRSSLLAGMMMFRWTGMDTQSATMVAFLRLVTKQKVVPLRYHNR